MALTKAAAIRRTDAVFVAEHRSTAGTADAHLLERFLAGEDGALVELYDRHHRRLALYCAAMLGDRDAARDAMQDLWMRLLRLRTRRAQRIDNPIGFFFLIARNLCLNRIAARRHHITLAELPEDAHPCERLESQSDREEAVVAAMEALPFEQREVLVMNVYCGYRFDEIAAMVGCSPEAAWKRASRARRALRELILREQETSVGELVDRRGR